jgi:hypothetical protein
MDNSSRKNNVTITFTIPSTLIPSFCCLMYRICKWNSRNSNNCIPPELISSCYSLLTNSQCSRVLCKEPHYHSDTQEISGLLWNSDIQCYIHNQSPLIPVSFLISRCILKLHYHFHRVWSPVQYPANSNFYVRQSSCMPSKLIIIYYLIANSYSI